MSSAVFQFQSDHQYCYNLKTLGQVKKSNLVSGLTQENSIGSSVQNHLLYILKAYDLCTIQPCQAWFTPGVKVCRIWLGDVNLWNDLGFSLCTVLSVCCVVAILEERKKSKMEVSADQCVTIEHQRSSSIRDYLC